MKQGRWGECCLSQDYGSIFSKASLRLHADVSGESVLRSTAEWLQLYQLEVGREVKHISMSCPCLECALKGNPPRISKREEKGSLMIWAAFLSLTTWSSCRNNCNQYCLPSFTYGHGICVFWIQIPNNPKIPRKWTLIFGVRCHLSSADNPISRSDYSRATKNRTWAGST